MIHFFAQVWLEIHNLSEIHSILINDRNPLSLDLEVKPSTHTHTHTHMLAAVRLKVCLATLGYTGWYAGCYNNHLRPRRSLLSTFQQVYLLWSFSPSSSLSVHAVFVRNAHDCKITLYVSPSSLVLPHSMHFPKLPEFVNTSEFQCAPRVKKLPSVSMWIPAL